jgi:hypothetical protein
MTLIVTPLLQLIREDNDPHRQSVYEIMKRNAERILHLVNQILDLRKIDKGQMIMQMRETDLIDFTADILKTFQPQATSKKINIEFEHESEKLPVWIDRSQFDKVIINLMSNAMKYTPVCGTVKVTILNALYGKASNTLIGDVQEALDPTGDGTGVGIAPIVHIVTVDTATEVTVNIEFTITMQDGYTFEGQKTLIEAAIEAYLLSLRKEWAENDSLIVRVSKIDNAVLSVEGVLDVTGTELNGESSNLQLTAYQIPVLGTVTQITE